ncbi:related to FMP25 Found in Mitochondrial Proteome [Ramularia collo-cygni]|uniref:Related to FMP25 Found in Mitochondrial Proteome n=1 Tax=Ramularia collo-cygni TaxID=112498 RepID=A0A2D3UTV8_9PEZI|nr:related to FMP25 Found in Mitochondrial Proteome [Ramularia collo-cygni]CZT15317.1 related to FMP25 Found in Mitochondrial Proteome [Ramularia collo-cygni]
MASKHAITRTAAQKTIPHGTRSASSRAAFLATQAQEASSSRAATLAYSARAQQKQSHLRRSIFTIVVAGGLASASQFYLNNGHFLQQTHAEAPPREEDNVPIIEQSRKKAGVSVEENRDMISSQHHQVKKSWENPGVYAWGSNTGRVAAPDSNENVIKTPRRMACFDGMLLRDIKLDRNFGAAIDEEGNLLQWGVGYAADTKAPVRTLAGKNLVELAISRDRILALSKGGKVYSIPVSAEEQRSGSKPSESSWIPFVSSSSPIAYRTLAPSNLASGEKIAAISSGLEHALLLTTAGRLFSTASASDSFPSRGQLGVPGLTWSTRPEGSFDQPHEITTLRGFPIKSIAAGDYHSLALDAEGRVFAWGDNASGQLGFDYNPESSIVDAPSLLSTAKLYSGSGQQARITSIAAGGSNSYITVDATKVAAQSRGKNSEEEDPRARLQIGRVTADTFSFGAGITGSLANSRWTHVQSTPTKIPTLSGLFEYDEQNNTAVPIRLAKLSVGSTHAAAVMANITKTSIQGQKGDTDDDTNWGADVVFWGGNEHYQLGTGKRNNVNVPVYLQPLDAEAEVKRARKSTGGKEEHRFHVTPRAEVKLGDGRRRSVEQRVECGRGVSGVYSAT